jgi:hypothetical protein
LDLPKLDAFGAYNKINPPLHLMVKSYLGAGEAPPVPVEQQNSDLDALMSMFPQTPQSE